MEKRSLRYLPQEHKDIRGARGMSQKLVNTNVLLGKNKGRTDSKGGLQSENAAAPGLQGGSLARRQGRDLQWVSMSQ